MKLLSVTVISTHFRMPPTRGHDLKQREKHNIYNMIQMPPTRGHDLKPEDVV